MAGAGKARGRDGHGNIILQTRFLLVSARLKVDRMQKSGGKIR